MHRHRLVRLAKLAQGTALITVGTMGAFAACGGDPPIVNSPPQDPHINAPADMGDAGASPTVVGDTTTTTTDAGMAMPHTVNSVAIPTGSAPTAAPNVVVNSPPKMPPDAGAPSMDAGRRPPNVNAPPKFDAGPAPKLPNTNSPPPNGGSGL